MASGVRSAGSDECMCASMDLLQSVRATRTDGPFGANATGAGEEVANGKRDAGGSQAASTAIARAGRPPAAPAAGYVPLAVGRGRDQTAAADRGRYGLGGCTNTDHCPA